MANGKLKLINRKVLFSLSDAHHQAKVKSAAIRGEIGQRMLEHQENSN